MTQARSLMALEHRLRGRIRLAGSGDSRSGRRGQPPRCAQRLLRRTAAALSGNLSTAAPVAASMILPSLPVTKTFLDSGSADSGLPAAR